MSQALTVQLSEETLASIERTAKVNETSADRVAAAALERQFASPKATMTDAEKATARARFHALIGSVDLGRPLGTDNEQIDEDLAKEYGRSHEDD